jgi:hypothetical protein
MKPFLLLILTLVLWQNAYAASFVGVNGLADDRLMGMASIHRGLDHLYDFCGSRSYLQITARRLDEKWENTVRQAVYFTNTGVNAPGSGVKAKQVDLKTAPGMESFVIHAFDLSPEEYANLSKEDWRMIRVFQATLGSMNRDVQFYVGEIENNFGPARFAVVLDLINVEVLLLLPNRCH